MEILTDGPTLVLSGDFDVRSTMEVRTAIYEHLEGHDEDVVIDLTDVDQRRRHRAQGAGGRHPRGRPRRAPPRAARRRPAVRRLLHLSRLIRVVELERRRRLTAGSTLLDNPTRATGYLR